MMTDGFWDCESDDPPFVGRAALAAGLAGVTAGVLVVAAGLAGAAWVHGRLHALAHR